MVDIDLPALQARGLTPADVVNAVNAQNVIAPSGTIKIDRFEYEVETNSAPTMVQRLNDLPIKMVNGTEVYVHDVAHVRDGSPPQTNIVRVNGRRGVLMNILKTGSASTLDIIAGVRSKVDGMRGQLPPQLQVSALSDQSIFVRGAIKGVVREGDHRRLPHRAHGAGISRQLALHDHHRGFDSAIHPAPRWRAWPRCTRPSTS